MLRGECLSEYRVPQSAPSLSSHSITGRAGVKLSYSQMRDIVRNYLDLEDRHYGMLILFAMHCRLGPSHQTDFCPYIGFIGNKESGKTNSTVFIVEMCNGVFVSKCTGAYLLHKMDELSKQGKCIGLDQLEDHLEGVDDLPAILEVGNRWTATYGMMERVKNKQTVKEITCGGPKVYNSLIPPKGTLRSRSYEIFTYPTSLAIQCSTVFPFRGVHMKELCDSLDEWAKDFKQRWSLSDVESYLTSDEHLNDLSRLQTYGARRLDMCNVFAPINHFLGWGVDVVGALSYDSGDEELDTFRDVLAEVITDKGWADKDVKARDICTAVNEKYHASKWDTLSETRFGILMANLGFGVHDASKYRSKKCSYYSFNQKTILKLGFTAQTRVSIWGTQGLKP